MTHEQEETLRKAIIDYDFPKFTFDFQRGAEVRHPTMRTVEAHIREALTSEDPEDVRDGLSNILYWGLHRVGYKSLRIARLREETTPTHFAEARSVFESIRGNGLRSLKKLKLPQFSQMSFITKLRMFLDPRNYVVLDKKLVDMAGTAVPTLFRDFKRYPTSIPVTAMNESVYGRWCRLCRKVAQHLFADDGYAVDVERGVFHLCGKEQSAVAAQIVGAAQMDFDC